jgi:Lrp/AsnC family transcriptional regulator, leucine-responsive regulatory protein
MTKNFNKIEEHSCGIESKLDLDNRDNIIISLLQKNPNVSQEEIAKKIKLSQPSVGARIKKLQQKGVINTINGINFKTVDLSLAKIDVTSTDTNAIVEEFKDCPFFINALITSGKHNLCLFFMATGLEQLEGIVNHHLRGNPKVKDVELNIVISTVKDFIMPLNIDPENSKQTNCKQECKTCIKSFDDQ